MSRSDHQRLSSAVRRGTIARIGAGVYVDAGVYRGMNKKEQNRLRIIAVARARGMPVVGRAAAFLHGFPFEFRMEAIPVELGRRKGADKTGAVLTRGTAPELPGHFIDRASPWGGFRVSSALRTTLDIARWHPLPEAVGMMEDGINRRLFTPADLRREAGHMKGVHAIAAIGQAVALSNTCSESPRESHLKACLFRAGLPAPLQQVEIRNEMRDAIARVDFLFEHISMVIEYDGQGKRHGQDGWSPELALRHEIQRHERLSREGLLVFRVDSTNYLDGSAVRKIKEIHESASRLYRPFPATRYSAKGRAW
ncbi:cysteine hydrolase [Corynebacterium pacaense]|uniref:cysteine hydrolase n=1 Tax=Corynebacterium pacaense TaxID=1816684 RepID=UPI0011786B26|nr:cysteine hydrolase [Corynebacterium pacaense]